MITLRLIQKIKNLHMVQSGLKFLLVCYSINTWMSHMNHEYKPEFWPSQRKEKKTELLSKTAQKRISNLYIFLLLDFAVIWTGNWWFHSITQFMSEIMNIFIKILFYVIEIFREWFLQFVPFDLLVLNII